jgi:DNA-binding MarR family transcriptional regulator
MTDRLLEHPSLMSEATSPTSSEAARVAARASHMMGADVEQNWQGGEAMAWEGLLEVVRRLRRGAEELLIEDFDLSISMLGIIGRLSLAPEHTLRQTALAQAMGLSLSRVSRVIDLLEQRGLIERQNCPADARATNVKLTKRGVALTARAQASLFGYVQASVFDHLDPGEVETLSSVFVRLLDLPVALNGVDLAAPVPGS